MKALLTNNKNEARDFLKKGHNKDVKALINGAFESILLMQNIFRGPGEKYHVKRLDEVEIDQIRKQAANQDNVAFDNELKLLGL